MAVGGTLVASVVALGTIAGLTSGASDQPPAAAPTRTAAPSTSSAPTTSLLGPATSLPVPEVLGTLDVPGTLAAVPTGGSIHVLVDGGLRRFDARTGTALLDIPLSGNPAAIAVDPSGERVAVVTTNPADLHLVETGSDTVTTVEVGGTPSAVALSPNGRTVYIADGLDDRITVVDAATAAVVEVLQVGSGRDALVVGAGGLACGLDLATGRAQELDLITGSVLRDLPGPADVTAIAVSANGRQWYLAHQSGRLSVVRSGVGPLDEVATPGRPVAVAVAPDGRHVYVIDGAGGGLVVLDADTNARTATVPLVPGARQIAVDSDGELATVSAPDGVTVLRTAR